MLLFHSLYILDPKLTDKLLMKLGEFHFVIFININIHIVSQIYGKIPLIQLAWTCTGATLLNIPVYQVVPILT